MRNVGWGELGLVVVPLQASGFPACGAYAGCFFFCFFNCGFRVFFFLLSSVSLKFSFQGQNWRPKQAKVWYWRP